MRPAFPTERIASFLASDPPDTPFLVVDLDVVRARYEEFVRAFPGVAVFYAVKANPAPPLLELLVDLGASFDVASPAEVDACLAAGADPARIAYTSTAKKQWWIADAYAKGVRIFAMDSDAELRKIAAVAPGATVCCRVLVDNSGADWPLSRKFGCEPASAVRLLADAHAAGLATGLAFHVGSQQHDIGAWDRALVVAAEVFSGLRARGVEPQLLNVGGGFPVEYTDPVPPIAAFGEAITEMLPARLGSPPPLVIAEPGRFLVAEAGVLQSEVLLVARKSDGDEKRWVYLDVGIFGGLAEAMGEAIRYRIVTPHDGGPAGPVVIAGPTCDSVDVLYEQHVYELPFALDAGDRVAFCATGAYTTTYSTVGFNGFAPLATHFLPAR